MVLFKHRREERVVRAKLRSGRIGFRVTCLEEFILISAISYRGSRVSLEMEIRMSVVFRRVCRCFEDVSVASEDQRSQVIAIQSMERRLFADIF